VLSLAIDNNAGEGDGCGVGVAWTGAAEIVAGFASWGDCDARASPGMASITQQQIVLAKPPTPVILSGTERRRSEVESKDPEIVFLTMPLQGVLTKIHPHFGS
jgi:hypothetical protein